MASQAYIISLKEFQHLCVVVVVVVVAITICLFTFLEIGYQ